MKRMILALAILMLAAASFAPARCAAQAGTTPKGSDAATPAVTPATTAVTPAPAATKATPVTAKNPASLTPKPALVDSVGLLERAVAKDSSKFDNLYRLGVLYLDRDRVNEAIRVFLKARTLKPKNNKLLVNLGAAFDAAGQPATAQKYYRDALALAPSDSVATCRLASSLYAQANYKDAMKLLRSMIARKTPGSYCAYFTMGVAFADAGIVSLR